MFSNLNDIFGMDGQNVSMGATQEGFRELLGDYCVLARPYQARLAKYMAHLARAHLEQVRKLIIMGKKCLLFPCNNSE